MRIRTPAELGALIRDHRIRLGLDQKSLAEKAEPETMRDLFRIYRDAATGAINALEGHVLQFQGDGIVACFGHPKSHGDDAQRAVLAGLEIVERMVLSSCPPGGHPPWRSARAKPSAS